MKRCLVGWAFLFCGLAVQAAVYYVDCDRPDNTGDGLSWATAKRTIQAAIDVATNGDTIRVGPGTYGEGTTPTPDSIIRSRVVCEKAIAIESTGGAEATISFWVNAIRSTPVTKGPVPTLCAVFT